MRFLEHLEGTCYDWYTLRGGESTLYPETMFLVLDKCRERNPKANLKLFTNGTLLTDEMVWALNERSVKVCLSLNLAGYKGLENFILKSANPSRQFDILRKIKKLHVKAVFQRHVPFAAEALILHNIFGCTVESSPDYTTLIDWDDRDLVYVERELELLNSTDKSFREWHRLRGCTDRELCDCQHESLHFSADGVIGQYSKFVSKRSIYGCSMFADQMSDELYARYQTLWRRFYGKEE